MDNKTSALGVKNIISRIILVFLFIGLLLILTFYTFFAGEKKELNTSNFNITEIGEKSLSGVILDKVDFYTTIYSKNKDYKKEKNNIKLGTGIYLIDSRDIFSELYLDMGTNKITLNGGGLVYINNNPKYKTIISFNNKIKIKFEAGAEIFLYPHMSISFRPYLINKQELDSLRVSQLAIVKYFNLNFSEIIDGKKVYFIKKENKSFLAESLKYLIKNQKKYSKELNILRSSKILDLSSTDFLEKYFIIFYNDRKKVVYYKNKTLKLLIKLLNNNDKNSVNDILEKINKISQLDKKEGSKMKEIVKEIFYLVSYSLGEDSYSIQNNYDLLISKLFNVNDTRKIKLIKDIDRQNYLGDFARYLKLTNLDIENTNLSLLDKEYYVLFKQNILTSNLKNINISDINYNILMKGLISYSNNIEKNITEKNKEKFLTNIKNNIKLLENLEYSINNRYFEEEKNSQNLLLFKRNSDINSISLLKKSIKNIINKYKKANLLDLLNNNQKFPNIKNRYNNVEKKLKEYIDALDNYTFYKKKYSKVNIELTNVKVYEDEEEKLSKEKFINYISQFSGIDLSSIDLQVEEYLYKVNNISINGYNFSFELIPDSGNVIQNIIFKNNGDYNNPREKGFYSHIEATSYELDKEKEKYSKLFGKAKNEEKEKYDFRNFFTNTFFLSNDRGVEVFNKDDVIVQDDEIIQTFKRAKLLGNKGEFRNIKDILKLNYSNLEVERKTGKVFLIKIINSDLKVYIEDNNRNVKYGALFNSDYKLEDNKHYFYNIKLEPFIKNNSSDKTILFPNVKFRIIGKIDLQNFENKITELFSRIKEIQKEYIKISKNKKVTKITYSALTGKFYIK